MLKGETMNITVYSASSGQVPPLYVDVARELGRELARRGHTLVNGAGRTGLMGAVADACLGEGGEASALFRSSWWNRAGSIPA